MNKSSIVPKVLVNPPNKSKLSYRLNGQHIKVVWNCFTVSVEHNAEAFLWEAHVSNFMGFFFLIFTLDMTQKSNCPFCFRSPSFADS